MLTVEIIMIDKWMCGTFWMEVKFIFFFQSSHFENPESEM